MSNDRRYLTELSESERSRAMERFAIIHPCLGDGVPIAYVARQHGLDRGTLRRWIARYRSEGLTGLARRERIDKGGHNIPEDLILLIEGLALGNPPRTAASIHRLVLPVARQHGWPEPSYKLVYNIVRRLDPALFTLAHKGSKRYHEMFDLIHRREAEHPNEIWQADHTELDIWLLDERGQPARPWLTIIEDDYSRAVPGYLLSFSPPSSDNTALALHQAIWRKSDPRWRACGIPQTFYTDHGSDFTSHRMEQVAADLKMALVYSEAGQPRGRGKIERFFQTVNQLFLSELPGYAPSGHKQPAPVLSLSELDVRFREWLIEYHHHRHGATGRPPVERWESGGFLPQMPEELSQLDLLLLLVAKPRKVQPDGIHFQGLRYIDLTLAGYVGESVVIRYDPSDLAEIRVYYEDRFLCRAICQELAGELISLKELVEARNRRRRQLHSDLGKRAKLVDQLLADHSAEIKAPEDKPEAEDERPRLRRYFNE